MGDVWIRLINSNNNVSSKLRHVLIEGHANSNPYPNMSEEENFLRNLSLSQDRALQAARFLIGSVTDPIHRGKTDTKLREVRAYKIDGFGWLEKYENDANVFTYGRRGS